MKDFYLGYKVEDIKSFDLGQGVVGSDLVKEIYELRPVRGALNLVEEHRLRPSLRSRRNQTSGCIEESSKLQTNSRNIIVDLNLEKQ